MIKYSCDICGEKCNERTFVLPIASTYASGEPWDVMPVSMNLCKECRRKIYKAIKGLTSKERIDELHEVAIDVHMGRREG